MIRLVSRLRRTLDGPARTDGLFECRHCGERVDRSTAACPVCGHTGIAEYDVE